MALSGGDAMNSTLKVQTSETRTLIEKIKAEIRKCGNEGQTNAAEGAEKTVEANSYLIIRSKSLSC